MKSERTALKEGCPRCKEGKLVLVTETFPDAFPEESEKGDPKIEYKECGKGCWYRRNVSPFPDCEESLEIVAGYAGI